MPGARYLRHTMIDWFDQAKLSQARVVVVGAGATGNEVLKNMCLLGIGHIHIIDFERIEVHNLTRAVLFTESDIGRYKAEAAAAACRRLDPGIEVTYSTVDFWKSLALRELKSYEALFSCVDNFEARIKLNQLALLAPVDFYNTAIDSRFVTAERYPFHTEKDSACYECHLPASVYGRMKERYSCGWLKKRAFSEKKVPTTIITSSMAGAGACSLYLQQNHPDAPKQSVRSYTDTISLGSSVSLLPLNPDCPVCSPLRRPFQYFRTKSDQVLSTLKSCAPAKDVLIWLSDRIILDVTCRQCGHRKVINDLAEKYDDSLLYCDRCRQLSNDVTIKDMLTLSEVEKIFAASPLPIKYLYFWQDKTGVILEPEA